MRPRRNIGRVIERQEEARIAAEKLAREENERKAREELKLIAERIAESRRVADKLGLSDELDALSGALATSRTATDKFGDAISNLKTTLQRTLTGATLNAALQGFLDSDRSTQSPEDKNWVLPTSIESDSIINRTASLLHTTKFNWLYDDSHITLNEALMLRSGSIVAAVVPIEAVRQTDIGSSWVYTELEDLLSHCNIPMTVRSINRSRPVEQTFTDSSGVVTGVRFGDMKAEFDLEIDFSSPWGANLWSAFPPLVQSAARSLGVIQTVSHYPIKEVLAA